MAKTVGKRNKAAARSFVILGTVLAGTAISRLDGAAWLILRDAELPHHVLQCLCRKDAHQLVLDVATQPEHRSLHDAREQQSYQ